VLGCYLTGDDKIHIYNVEESELDGVKESTTAHELLHAVYLRLPFWEKNSLNNELKKVYDELPEDDDIKSSMKLYSSEDFYDELHSRLGTEKKDLSFELEKHYEAIFKDQDKIVDFYTSYSGTFKKYEKETEALGKRLESLQSEIDAEEERLKTLANDLNARIDNYNGRVTSHNYTDVNAIRLEGSALQAEVNNINSAYDALNAKIDEYNNLIGEYNSSVVRTNQIFNSINSNSEKFETVSN
jgi:chromosome segregation ATPase